MIFPHCSIVEFIGCFLFGLLLFAGGI